MKTFQRLFFAAVLLSILFCAVPPAYANTSNDDVVAALKEQVELLRKQVKQYEETNARVEARLASIEKALEAGPKETEEAKAVYPASVKEAASEVIARDKTEVAKIATKAQISTLQNYGKQVAQDSVDILNKIPDYLPNYITKGLEFHGYFRSGYGVNSRGDKMQAFQAPDAPAKYRLGNEQETYIETVFLNRNWNPDPEGVTLETQIRTAYTTQQTQTSDNNNQINLREMYGRMGHFVEWDPNIKVWAGQRFLRLPELDIIDFWWYDLSGYGAGFEDITLPIGKLAVTFVGYASTDPLLLTNRGIQSKENLNFMLSDVDVPFGKGTFWVNGGFLKGGIDSASTGIKYPDIGGVDVGFMHYIPGELNNNQFAVQYGCGSNTSLSAAANIPSGGDDRESWRVRLTDMYNRQITDKLCVQAVGVYQYTDYGHATKNSETWISVGARPIYMLTKHFGLEIEPGMDYINNPRNNYDTCLFKLTSGLRISPGVIFNSRPDFRIFATYARWGNGFKGNPMLGGNAFVSQREGMNYGVQCENWW